MKISDVIKNEWYSYKKQSISLEEGYTFSQYETIKRIGLYLNDQYYESGNEDAIFWNLSTPRVPHFAKNLDFDTKDFLPIGKGETNYFQAWILRMKVKKFYRDTGFGEFLNDLAEGLAEYGSHIVKRVRDYSDSDNKYRLDEVKLNTVAFDPTVKNVRDSSFFIQRHVLTATELRARADVWDNVEEVIATANEVEKAEDGKKDYTEVPSYEVFERWGEVEDNGKFINKHYIVSGEGDKEIILFEETYKDKDFPYYDFHVGKYKGTWLRKGVVQRLFALQERANRLVNQNATTTEIASLLLLRTDDEETSGNVLNSTESGDIVFSKDLQQIPIDNRFLNGFIAELNLIERQADKLCLTPDIVTAEKMPSSMPFRGMAIMNNIAKSAFRPYKESISERLGKVLMEEIFPDLVKKWNDGGIVKIADDEHDVVLYDNLKTNRLIWEAIGKHISKKNRTPINEQLIELTSRITEEMGKDDRKVEIKEGFFNFEYGFEMNPSNETEDKAAMNDALNNALNMKIANPQIADDPLFKELLEKNNIAPKKVSNKMAESQPIQQGSGKPVKPITRDKLLKEVQ